MGRKKTVKDGQDLCSPVLPSSLASSIVACRTRGQKVGFFESSAPASSSFANDTHFSALRVSSWSTLLGVDVSSWTPSPSSFSSSASSSSSSSSFSSSAPLPVYNRDAFLSGAYINKKHRYYQQINKDIARSLHNYEHQKDLPFSRSSSSSGAPISCTPPKGYSKALRRRGRRDLYLLLHSLFSLYGDNFDEKGTTTDAEEHIEDKKTMTGSDEDISSVKLHYIQGFHDIASVFLMVCVAEYCSASSPGSGSLPGYDENEDDVDDNDDAIFFDKIDFGFDRRAQQRKQAEGGNDGKKNELNGTDAELLVAHHEKALVQAFELLRNFSFLYGRDALRPNIQPMVRVLSLVFTLLRSTDTEVYTFLLASDVQPFFALSWILTWFSHNLVLFPLVLRLFDFLLSSHPLAVIYVTVAFITLQRDSLLSTSCDFASVHQYFQALPDYLAPSQDKKPGEETETENDDDEIKRGSRGGLSPAESLDALLHTALSLYEEIPPVTLLQLREQAFFTANGAVAEAARKKLARRSSEKQPSPSPLLVCMLSLPLLAVFYYQYHLNYCDWQQSYPILLHFPHFSQHVQSILGATSPSSVSPVSSFDVFTSQRPTIEQTKQIIVAMSRPLPPLLLVSSLLLTSSYYLLRFLLRNRSSMQRWCRSLLFGNTRQDDFGGEGKDKANSLFGNFKHVATQWLCALLLGVSSSSFSSCTAAASEDPIHISEHEPLNLPASSCLGILDWETDETCGNNRSIADRTTVVRTTGKLNSKIALLKRLPASFSSAK